MKSRWLINLILLALVAGIGAFLYMRPKPAPQPGQEAFSVSKLDPGVISLVKVEKLGKVPVIIEKKQGRWRMSQPYAARADATAVGRIISILGANTKERLPATDLARFGLDSPTLKVQLDNEELVFGMFHPVSGEQFVLYKDAVYVLPTLYSEAAQTQPLELLDKHLLDADEQIAGFDFSGLEQWEQLRLNLDLQSDGKWKVTPEKAKPNQEQLNEWLSNNWSNLVANSVEPYTPDRAPHPFFVVRLKSGKSVHFLKLQESPELVLAREDHGMRYRFPQEVGFEALNPPVGFKQD